MLGKDTIKYDDWRKGLFLSIEYSDRIIYLEMAKETESPETVAWLEEILNKRYTVARNGKATDHFMGAWLEIRYLERLIQQPFGVKRAKKAAGAIIRDLMLDQEYPDWKQELLLDEYEHLVRSYVLICQDDRSYNSRIMNFIAMKPDALEKKLIDDIYGKVVKIPQRLELEEKFAPLAAAAARITG